MDNQQQISPQQVQQDPPQLVQQNPPQLVQQDPPQLVQQNPPQLVQQNPPQLVQQNPPQLVQQNPPQLVQQQDQSSVEGQGQIPSSKHTLTASTEKHLLDLAHSFRTTVANSAELCKNNYQAFALSRSASSEEEKEVGNGQAV